MEPPPPPKREIVVCDLCRREVKMRARDGKEYHVGGEPGDGHRPVAVPGAPADLP